MDERGGTAKSEIDAGLQRLRMPGGQAVYSIAAGLPFLDCLAGTLLATYPEPGNLARLLILLPNRRSCLALREAFLRQHRGQPLLLPRLRPLGEIELDELVFGDEESVSKEGGLPPPISPLRRQLLLTQAIWKAKSAQRAALAMLATEPSQERGGRFSTSFAELSPDQAAILAAALARFLDQIQIERLSLDRLSDLVEGEYARHWQLTLDFLAILHKAWPAILAEEGALDPAHARNLGLDRQAAQWRKAPPDHPIIAAGTTGSLPAVSDLLSVIAGLPQGRIVLPGFPESWDGADGEAIPEDPCHPHYHMARLIRRLGLAAEEIQPWPLVSAQPLTRHQALARQGRSQIIQEAMRPAVYTQSWPLVADRIDRDASLRRQLEAGLQEVLRIDCRDLQEEAGVIALHLRAALTIPDKRAILITPNRKLARRVAVELRRWGVVIDDSGGQPLGQRPCGNFLCLLADALINQLAPAPLLALLQHPYMRMGQAPEIIRGKARLLDRHLLRGSRPQPGFAGLKAALAMSSSDVKEALAPWLAELETEFSDALSALQSRRHSLPALLKIHLSLAEKLSQTPEGDALLWRGEDGKALFDFIQDLLSAAEGFPDIRGAAYPGLFSTLLSNQVVRPHASHHPRLAILGPIEGRLQSADLVILGGLNEGTWPQETAADPWMSRPMRAAFGLPPLERKIGLSAHDFVQAFCAPEVVLTRAMKQEGTPTVPSRWLTRLDGFLEAAGLRLKDGQHWRRWWAGIDRPWQVTPMPPPMPKPPLAARPRKLSVTDIEKWLANPYAIYARHILKLIPLEPLDADPDAADRGSLIHKILARFIAGQSGALPDDALARLIAIGAEEFHPLANRPALWAFWWPRFLRIAEAFIAAEAKRRPAVAKSYIEQYGRLEIPTPQGQFLLTATADRIDHMQDGSLQILDYKTGAPPANKAVMEGRAPQLPLEAAIAARGGFPGLPETPIGALLYWPVRGRPQDDCPYPVGAAVTALADSAYQGLRRRIVAFQDPAQAYLVQGTGSRASIFDDYDHLARRREWQDE